VDLVTGRSVKATVSFDTSIEFGDDLLKARMANQFSKLDVNARIASEITEFISEASGQIEDNISEPSAELIKKHLIKRTERYLFGSWQSALLRALANSVEFCNDGWKKVLPKKL